MAWYGQSSTGNPLSGSATHGGQQFPASFRVQDGSSAHPAAYATAPPELIIQDPPSHVIINGIGTYQFAYNLTGSVGTTVVAANHDFTTAIITVETQAIKLEISPSAWNGGGGATGDVTFVYRARSK